MPKKTIPLIQEINAITLTVEELNFANLSAGHAAIGNLHPLPNPENYGLNIEDQDSSIYRINFTDNRFNRTSLAMKKAFAHEPKKFKSALARLMAAADFIKKNPEIIKDHYQEEENEYCEMSRPLMEAFATLPLTNKLEFNKDQMAKFLVDRDPNE